MLRWAQYPRRFCQIGWLSSITLGEIAWDRLRGRTRIPGPERLRLLLERLSGSFLKFGQILSLQIDTLPREYCDALLNLLDRVPPFSREQVRELFVKEMGKAPEKIYREFDYKPLASASIGQVHRAVLPDSTVVAVKVQRPGIREAFLRDAALLRFLVRVVFLFKIRSLYFMRDPVREFNEWILDELDYRQEARYAEVLGRNAQATTTEVIPRIHWNLTTSRVLTMDFLAGYSVLEYMRLKEERKEPALAELSAMGFDPPQFASNVINNFLSDAFRFGVFHADLHPANLLILKDNMVGYVDFGIVGNMTAEAREKVIRLSMAYAGGKTEEIFAAFLNISEFTKDADLAGFRRDLEQRCHLWYREPAIGGVPRLNRSLTVAMFDLLTLCRRYGLLVDREMVKYIRSLILADGLVSRLAPGLDLAPQIRQVCQEFLAREAQEKLFSEGAALTLLADLSGWLLAGPGPMLQALELIGQSSARFSVSREYLSEDREALRHRAFLVTAVWFSVAVLATRQTISSATISFLGVLLLGFLGVWTAWLVNLLRRLTRQ